MPVLLKALSRAIKEALLLPTKLMGGLASANVLSMNPYQTAPAQALLHQSQRALQMSRHRNRQLLIA